MWTQFAETLCRQHARSKDMANLYDSLPDDIHNEISGFLGTSFPSILRDLHKPRVLPLSRPVSTPPVTPLRGPLAERYANDAYESDKFYD
jgi:hypothetical protein